MNCLRIAFADEVGARKRWWAVEGSGRHQTLVPPGYLPLQ